MALSTENAIFWNIIDYGFQRNNTLYIIYYYLQQFLLPMCQINGKFHLTEKLLTWTYTTVALDSIPIYSWDSLRMWEWGYVLEQKNVLTIIQDGIYILYLLHVAIDYLKCILSNTVLNPLCLLPIAFKLALSQEAKYPLGKSMRVTRTLKLLPLYQISGH